MNINIETKFNIGDTVYVTEYYNDIYYASKRRCIISHISIYANPNLVIAYNVIDKDLDMMSEYSESMLFSTYEECKKWCDEKNCTE